MNQQQLEVHHTLGQTITGIHIEQVVTMPPEYRVVFRFKDGTCFAVYTDHRLLRCAPELACEQEITAERPKRARRVYSADISERKN